MAFILLIGESTIQIIIAVLVVFMEAIFLCINLKPDNRFSRYKMSEVFNKTGHGLTDICNCLN